MSTPTQPTPMADLVTRQRAQMAAELEQLRAGLVQAQEAYRIVCESRGRLRARVDELEAAARPVILDLPPDRHTRRLIAERGERS